MENTVIVTASRTPIGSFNGKLSHIPAPRLGADVIREVISRTHIKGEDISQVIMGCVLTAGMGQAPARQAALFSGLPHSVPCTTIGKVCGSGLQSVILGSEAIQTGDASIVVAGGMENMSLTPHLLEKARSGYRMGHGQVTDSMIKDGLWDPYNEFHMGACAELCAKECNFSRKEQDEYAIQSYTRALSAQKEGLFKEELIPMTVVSPKGASYAVEEDEELTKVNLEKLPLLAPAFEKNGTVTAGNASKINDAAAAVLLMSESEAKKRGIKPLAKIIAHASHAQAPEWFTTAPVEAIKKVLAKAKLKISDIDLFEINEAFAIVTLAAIDKLSLDDKKVNVHGGAIALGHPIGASGTRILTTLLYAMKHRNARLGCAAICIGGGEALAVIVER
ncbi:MAG: acetyl-CoA acetyltransferase [Deltaproteobacteria bacterium GWA2_38_16]|nr:MAG: acetyl-CoA acetyltransferase [Deltaproteobacteria bacterium GWA2_38_16]OGQ02960.1 MAG: acetyl-CoA acetyltransferase [Deltaproteobacteria bacterium RIFCSPHIGHO2_02_FULL_38_15]OGQ62750.1 MAG: acetyl-CoA acetyltransferase [Deltaproteobacteria bacterium RIFCSPLOWO2_12_FULL_38_8]HBQ21939.1 acetyl-CoA C-acetyltransferase [Deltaproteobacteria bacterium]